jgi:hypothetical protein
MQNKKKLKYFYIIMSSQTKSYQIVLETNTITESKMSADKVINAECPICMDAIEGLCNRVVTECGHAFHCACLMQNASHNGFGCPYCRTAMATEPVNDDEDDDDDDGWSVDETVFHANALTSFRLFHQRNNGEELEEEEEEEDWETDDEEEAEEDEEEAVQEPSVTVTAPVTAPVTPSVPDSTYTSNKLRERGVTFEDLVKHILNNEHDQWGEHYGDYTRRSDEVYGQFKAVMSNYARSQRNQNQINQSVQTATTTQTPNPVLTLPEVAESKTPVTRQREVLAHV